MAFKVMMFGGYCVSDDMAQRLTMHFYPTLVANPGNRAFYEKFGFQQGTKGFTAMCIR